MKLIKKRFFNTCIAMIVIVSMLMPISPDMAQQVNAAEPGFSMSWLYVTGFGKNTIQVEKGQKFYVGDLVKITDVSAGTSGVATNFAVSYKSSKPKVAKIDKRGMFTAKKAGVTKVTIKYKDEKMTCKFEVVEKGSFGTSNGAEAMKRASANLAKKIPQEITVKNGYKLLQATLIYEEIQKVHLQEVNRNGFLVETDAATGKSVTTTKMVVPQVGRYQCLINMLYDFETKFSPVSELSSKQLKLKSVKATQNAITVKLKKKITAEQVLAGQINQSSSIYSPYELNNKKAMVQVTISGVDVKAGLIVGYMSLEKGKKQATIVPMKISYETGEPTYKVTKLKKGKTYRIGTISEWTKGKTVTVK